MIRIILPEEFSAGRRLRTGGVSREIARCRLGSAFGWRLSVAEVARSGPLSRLNGLSRILTVIDGAGLDLRTPSGVLRARPLAPVAFAGDADVEAELLDDPVRNLSLVFDNRIVHAAVASVRGPLRLTVGAAPTGFMSIAGCVVVDGATLPAGAFALGEDGELELGGDGTALVVSLSSA